MCVLMEIQMIVTLLVLARWTEQTTPEELERREADKAQRQARADEQTRLRKQQRDEKEKKRLAMKAKAANQARMCEKYGLGPKRQKLE